MTTDTIGSELMTDQQQNGSDSAQKQLTIRTSLTLDRLTWDDFLEAVPRIRLRLGMGSVSNGDLIGHMIRAYIDADPELIPRSSARVCAPAAVVVSSSKQQLQQQEGPPPPIQSTDPSWLKLADQYDQRLMKELWAALGSPDDSAKAQWLEQAQRQGPGRASGAMAHIVMTVAAGKSHSPRGLFKTLLESMSTDDSYAALDRWKKQKAGGEGGERAAAAVAASDTEHQRIAEKIKKVDVEKAWKARVEKALKATDDQLLAEIEAEADEQVGDLKKRNPGLYEKSKRAVVMRIAAEKLGIPRPEVSP